MTNKTKTGKQQVKDPSDYWYIHGETYDFSTFQHPGGPVAISLGKGRDCTGLFETYHPFTDKPKSVMKKYKITTGEIPTPPKCEERFKDVFTWSKYSEFYTELIARVKPLIKENSKWTWERMFFIYILLTLEVYIGVNYFFRGYYWSILVYPLLCWVRSVNSFHDAAHFALSKNWVVNTIFAHLSPFFCSPYTWYHQHVIGHHVYTNHHGLDPDLHHGSYVFRYCEKSRYYKWYKHQMKYLIVLWSFIVFAVNFMCDFWLLKRGFYHKIIKAIKISDNRKRIHILGRFLTFFFIYLYPFFAYPFFKALVFATIPYYIYSWCFSFCSQLNHLTQETMKNSSKDFYAHQVMTSHDFAVDSNLWFWFTGGLNNQVSHHLFPGVNHCHLYKIQPHIKELCAKYKIPYHCSSTGWEAFMKHMNHMVICSKANEKNDSNQ